MNFSRLDYIKNVQWYGGWAYHDFPVGSYFRLRFEKGNTEKKEKDVASHISKTLKKNSLIILSQKPPFASERYLTHIVELVNDGLEDEKQWQSEASLGFFRWVKVCWVADFEKINTIPLDQKYLKVDWGYETTFANSLNGKKLMTQFKDIDELRQELAKVFS